MERLPIIVQIDDYLICFLWAAKAQTQVWVDREANIENVKVSFNSFWKQIVVL